MKPVCGLETERQPGTQAGCLLRGFLFPPGFPLPLPRVCQHEAEGSPRGAQGQTAAGGKPPPLRSAGARRRLRGPGADAPHRTAPPRAAGVAVRPPRPGPSSGLRREGERGAALRGGAGARAKQAAGVRGRAGVAACGPRREGGRGGGSRARPPAGRQQISEGAGRHKSAAARLQLRSVL